MIYEAKCPICGKVNKLEIDDTAFMAYKAGVGKIQHLFPNLKPEEQRAHSNRAFATHAGTTCFRRTKNERRRKYE